MSQDAKGFATNSVGVKPLVIIAALTIAYQAYASSDYVSDDWWSFADFSYGITSLAVGIAALIVAKRYRGSPIFGKTYLAFGIGFVVLFIGDMTYNYHLLVLVIDPYPSIADIFFIGFYFFYLPPHC